MTIADGRRRVVAPRLVLGVLEPLVLLGVALLPWLALGDRLPDPVAGHWDAGGRADGSVGRDAAVWQYGGLVAALCAGLVLTVVVAALRRLPPASVALPAGLLASLGGLLALASASTALANRNAEDWRHADLALPWVGVVALAAVACGAVGAVAGARLGTARPATPGAAPAMPLGPGELVTWSGRCTARGPAAVFCIVVVLATVPGAAGLLGSRWTMIPVLVLSLPLAALFAVRVTVGADGLRARSSIVPWPAVTIPLERIARARAVDVVPAQWGGWGYRGGLRLLRKAAWVVRRGDGIVVTLHDGRQFAVTVDSAGEGASVLNALLDRQTPAGSAAGPGR